MSPKEFQIIMDTTKKEIRAIRAVESQLGWDMLREDKHDKMSAEMQALEDIRAWRQEQSEGMKALVAEKKLQAQFVELGESKAYQEFKRASKLNAQEEERLQHHEAYLQDLENAVWRRDVALAAHANEKEVLVERHENVMDARLIKTNSKLQEKQDEAAKRSSEQELEMALLIKDIQQERLQAIENLAYSRACYKNPRPSTARH